MAKLRITYSKSAIGYTVRQKATVKALGFTHLYQTVEHEDTPAIRGMIQKINHLLTVEEVR
ncbi:MAG: 50S ribosomal protein L30 [Candidatus Promineofilum sp.]|nr:50S ribosomal protein L30 [Promineifilum sp.]MBP9656987.1 50S ribosomal protein L30 [Promineifilum sp.]MBW7958947.1 50S ribosomal protein L30 [Promineifilum sp.]MCZ2113790.1 50S ribosomal protein L30 [Anaerolineae bacterium]